MSKFDDMIRAALRVAPPAKHSKPLQPETTRERFLRSEKGRLKSKHKKEIRSVEILIKRELRKLDALEKRQRR